MPDCYSQTSVVDLSGWGSRFHATMALAVLSTILYGLNISLAISCLKSTIARRKSFTSKSKLVGSYLYIAAMVAFASQDIIHLHMIIINTIKDLFLSFLTPGACISYERLLPENLFDIPIALPLSIWGADGVLIWRCVILYNLVGRRRQLLLYGLLGLLALSSIGSGMTYVSPVTSGLVITEAMLPVTCITNGIVSILIAVRLIQAQRLLSKVHTDHIIEHEKRLDPYLTALAICVESSAMIVVVALMAAVRPLRFEPIIVLPQICVMSPLLIIYRVANNRPEEPISRLEGTLQFHHTQQSGELESQHESP